MRPVTDLQRKVAPFRVVTDMVPAGDQPTAIAEIDKRVKNADALAQANKSQAAGNFYNAAAGSCAEVAG